MKLYHGSIRLLVITVWKSVIDVIECIALRKHTEVTGDMLYCIICAVVCTYIVCLCKVNLSKSARWDEGRIDLTTVGDAVHVWTNWNGGELAWEAKLTIDHYVKNGTTEINMFSFTYEQYHLLRFSAILFCSDKG